MLITTIDKELGVIKRQEFAQTLFAFNKDN